MAANIENENFLSLLDSSVFSNESNKENQVSNQPTSDDNANKGDSPLKTRKLSLEKEHCDHMKSTLQSITTTPCDSEASSHTGVQSLPIKQSQTISAKEEDLHTEISTKQVVDNVTLPSVKSTHPTTSCEQSPCVTVSPMECITLQDNLSSPIRRQSLEMDISKASPNSTINNPQSTTSLRVTRSMDMSDCDFSAINHSSRLKDRSLSTLLNTSKNKTTSAINKSTRATRSSQNVDEANALNTSTASSASKSILSGKHLKSLRKNDNVSVQMDTSTCSSEFNDSKTSTRSSRSRSRMLNSSRSLDTSNNGGYSDKKGRRTRSMNKTVEDHPVPSLPSSTHCPATTPTTTTPSLITTTTPIPTPTTPPSPTTTPTANNELAECESETVDVSATNKC